MSKLQSIISLWPTRRDLATAAGERLQKVHDWFRPDRAPPAKFDLRLWRDAQERGLPVTLDQFIAARESQNGTGATEQQENEL